MSVIEAGGMVADRIGWKVTVIVAVLPLAKSGMLQVAGPEPEHEPPVTFAETKLTFGPTGGVSVITTFLTSERPAVLVTVVV